VNDKKKNPVNHKPKTFLEQWQRGVNKYCPLYYITCDETVAPEPYAALFNHWCSLWRRILLNLSLTNGIMIKCLLHGRHASNTCAIQSMSDCGPQTAPMLRMLHNMYER
jgi:hypothetical protein